MKASATTTSAGKSTQASWVLYDIAVFSVFYIIFFCILKYVLWTDFTTHMQIIKDQIKSGDHFAVYMALPRYCFLLLSKFSAFFNGQLGDETSCLVFMLSLAVFLKYYFTRRMIKYFIASCSELNCRIYAFSLAFVAPVALGMNPDTVHRWTATLPTSCWHNLTIIFCITFSLGLFWYTVRWFKDGYCVRDFIFLCMFLILSILSKPSYMFAFLPAYCLLTLLYLPRELSRRLLACIPVVIVIALYLVLSKQMLLFKALAYGREVKVYGQGIYWAPWEYYLHHLKDAKTIFRVHFCSVIFPLMTGMYLGVAYLKNRGAISITFIAVLLQSVFGLSSVYCFNMGTDFDRFHGNMTWQIMPCNYILFTLCVIAILRERLSSWCTILLTVYGMHVVCGLVFLVEIFRTKAGWVDPVIGWWTKSP